MEDIHLSDIQTGQGKNLEIQVAWELELVEVKFADILQPSIHFIIDSLRTFNHN